MRNPEGVIDPFLDNEGVDRRELRIREMKFPPEMRMSGSRQSLRDAYLGRMMLNSAIQRPRIAGIGAMWDVATRENGRAQLNRLILELESKLGPEESQKCRDVAVEIFSWVINERRNGRTG
ncbi:hypothetical protein [Nocardia sp. NPDC057440]|uniref:hypothetical protein n=1 Tax=Nocardia sp. NPDC057440 TaxID=3346134 RepID=UPI003672C2E0